MVVIFHLPAPLTLPELEISILSSGVDIFFVISGFVMVTSTAHASRGAATFMMQRLTRIVPFYWLMTLVMAASLWIFSGRLVSMEDIIRSLFFIPYHDTFRDFVQPVLGVGWTLNLEILFYLLFAATMAFGALAQMSVIGVVFALAVAARIIFKPGDDTVLFFYTTPMFFEFLAGMALGHLADKLQRLPAAIGVAAIIGAVASIFVMDANFNMPRTIEQGIPAVLLVLGCLRLENYFQNDGADLPSRLGDASYSLYLTHPIVLLAATPLIKAADVSPWLSGGGVILACILVGLVCHQVIEKRLLACVRTGGPVKVIKAQGLR